MKIITTKPFDLNDFKIGYFLVHKGTGSFFNNQIVLEQRKEGFEDWKCEYTHVGTSIGAYSLDAIFPKSGVFNIRKKFGGKEIMLVRAKGYNDEKHKKFAIWSATKTNLPYGWFSLLYFKAEAIFGDKNILASIKKPFCSYKEGWAMHRELIGFWDKPLNKLMPADFLDQERFEYIWQGVIPSL